MLDVLDGGMYLILVLILRVRAREGEREEEKESEAIYFATAALWVGFSWLVIVPTSLKR